MAGILAQHDKRLAYENWCWSSHAPNWKDVWEIVRAVNKPNVGLCLDTFQTGGGEWADPNNETGLLDCASRDELDRRFKASLDELSASVPGHKIFVLQISDAYQVRSPMDRATWSQSFRPMPYDGGYLPVVDVVKAVLKTGFRGWFSMEIFDGGPDGKGRSYDINAFARQSMRSMQRLLEACALECN